MDEANQQPARDQIGLPGDHGIQQRVIGALGLRQMRIVAADHMIGEAAHAISVAARGEELEGADTDMAGRHAGQHRAGQHRLAHHAFA